MGECSITGLDLIRDTSEKVDLILKRLLTVLKDDRLKLYFQPKMLKLLK